MAIWLNSYSQILASLLPSRLFDAERLFGNQVATCRK